MTRLAHLITYLFFTGLVLGTGLVGATRDVDGPQRRYRDFIADTLWTAGGTQEDTSLLIPNATAVGGDAVYVLDRGGPRVAAFDSRDGTLRWIRGRRGSGPHEFTNPTALDVAPDGTVLVADAHNARIARLGPDGRWLPSRPLENVSYVSGLCALADGRILLTVIADTAPVLILAADGRAQRRALPWPDLARASGMAVQTALATSPDARDCYLGLYLGRGFARWHDDRFDAPVPYIEHFDLPGVIVSSSGNRSVTRLTDPRIALGDVAVTDSSVIFAFRGMSEHRNRILDVYGRDGTYSHSFRFDIPIMGIDYGRGLLLLRSSPGGVPAIHAIRIRSP